jgi:hypothetical protein
MIGSLALCAAWSGGASAQLLDEAPTIGPLMRMFTDSHHVRVRSLVGNGTVPLGSASLSLHWNNERVTVPGITAPPGSQEAVDAITTASRPISGNAYQDFIKLRNEFEGEVARGGAAVDYYASQEQDYRAHQLGARYHRDVMSDLLDVSVGTSYGWDAIDPLPDDDTHTSPDTKTTLHVNAVATRILSPTTLFRVGIETNVVDGLQHNPYRNVYAGGTVMPERHPDHRERRDAFMRVNQYLPNRSSLKLNYRYYQDDWGVDSHELGSRLGQYITRGLSARWEYRWYTQTRADFYRDEYESVDGIDGYRSGDYRLNRLSSHLFGAGLDADLDALAESSPILRHLALWFTYERYFNSNNYSADILETGLDFRFQ